MYFEYWESDNDGKWYWHLKAVNHKIIAVASQGYTTAESCMESIEMVQKGAIAAFISRIESKGETN